MMPPSVLVRLDLGDGDGVKELMNENGRRMYELDGGDGEFGVDAVWGSVRDNRAARRRAVSRAANLARFLALDQRLQMSVDPPLALSSPLPLLRSAVGSSHHPARPSLAPCPFLRPKPLPCLWP